MTGVGKSPRPPNEPGYQDAKRQWVAASKRHADVPETQEARATDESAPPQFLYTCVEDWFINLLAPTIQRRLDASGAGTLTWCPHWWEHPEANARLEALWRAWEVCRDADGEAPSRWFWQHCDPMLTVLMDAKVGPLSDCKPTEHRKYSNTSTLPFEPAPAGYWGVAIAASAQIPGVQPRTTVRCGRRP